MVTRFLLRIAVPALLTFALSCLTLFVILIPAVRNSILERKQETMHELTVSAWCILAGFDKEVQAGNLTREQAQQEAIRQVRNLRYGPAMEDYFWINDLTPRMVVHPYRPDLEGKDLSGIQDPDGKRLFVEFVQVATREGGGFVHYRWQWMDDPSRIVPKLSYVRLFEPWGWVLGTGVYLEDVREEIDAVTRRLVYSSCVILAAVGLLLLLMLQHGLRAERLKRGAEVALRESEERYRLLVESAGESIILALGEDRLYANASALRLLGYGTEEFGALRLRSLVRPEAVGAEVDGLTRPGHASSGARGATRHECELMAHDGRAVPVMLSCSPITVAGRNGVIVVATDITERKRREEAGARHRSSLEQHMDRIHQRQAAREETLRELQTALLLLQAPDDREPVGAWVRRLRTARDPVALADLNRQLPALVGALVASGAQAEAISRFITANTNTVLEQLVGFALQRLGSAPADFAFLVMGSEGRQEQTLCTDQDNALLFADPDPGQAAAVSGYFQRLGDQVCTWLNDAGYAFCRGGTMARDPSWCQPLSAWQTRVTAWARASEGLDLPHAKVFLDVRCGHGSGALLETLRQTLRAELAAHPRFLAQLAMDVLRLQPPVRLLGGIAVQTVGEEHRRVLDIKYAMAPIVDVVRIYALRQGLPARNTIERLGGLLAADVLTPERHDEIVQVYRALMQMRIEHQVRALGEKRPVDNLVEPRLLTHLQRRVLRESFAQIRDLQRRLGHDFAGLHGVPE